MVALQKRAKSFYVLFLSCFIIYAASPLSFTYSEDTVSGDVHGTVSPVRATPLHIFLLDLALSGFSPKEDARHEGSSGVTVLLRKVRAVISKNKAAKLINLEMIAATGLLFPVCFLSRAVFALNTQYALRAPGDFCPLYSGLSPPDGRSAPTA